MIWIVSKAEAGSDGELESRRRYIEKVTNSSVTKWMDYIYGSPVVLPEYNAESCDNLSYLFITAHTDEVVSILFKLPDIMGQEKYKRIKKVVINSCLSTKKWIDIMGQTFDALKMKASVYYALQDKVIWRISDSAAFFVNYPEYVGAFGFPITRSERILFRNRRVGIDNAIEKAFVRL